MSSKLRGIAKEFSDGLSIISQSLIFWNLEMLTHLRMYEDFFMKKMYFFFGHVDNWAVIRLKSIIWKIIV